MNKALTNAVAARKWFARFAILTSFVLLLTWSDARVSRELLAQQAASSASGQQTKARESRSASTNTDAAKRRIIRYQLAPQKYADAVTYSRARYRLYFIDTAYAILVLVLL